MTKDHRDIYRQLHSIFTLIVVYCVFGMSSRLVAHGPGLEEEATVDEVEAVRTVSGEPPGYIITL
jgi:hypothetical protein